MNFNVGITMDNKNGRTLLETVDLYQFYKLGKTKLVALKGISIKLPQGKIIGITGPSGAGKSTFLHLIGGLERPSSGTIYYQNELLDSGSQSALLKYRRTQIGFVFQFDSLDINLNVSENIELPMIFVNKSKTERFSRIQELLDSIGITHLANRPIATLSGGERQRVSICVGMANNPPLLLADEPTGELDSENTEIIKSLFKKINQEFGTTIIVVSHNKEVIKIADHVIEFKDGNINHTTIQN